LGIGGKMDTEEKLNILKVGLNGQWYDRDDSLRLLLEEKIEELEQRKIGEMMRWAIKNKNKIE